jgi:hypothetical protein
MVNGERISPSALLSMMGITPADNRQRFTTALPWKSNMVGAQTEELFQYQKLLDTMI